MPRIILSKNRVIDVTLDEASRVEGEWKNPEVKIITIGNAAYRRGEIASIDKGSPVRGEYDAESKEDREAIHSFESELKAAEQKELSNPIEYYGEPYEAFCKRKNITNRYPGYVFNEMLGLVHAGVVAYAIEHNAIHKMSNGRWAISDLSMDKRHHDISAYSEFSAKMRALRELRSKRDFAETKKAEEIERLMDGAHETIFEGFDGAPSDDEIDAALDSNDL